LRFEPIQPRVHTADGEEVQLQLRDDALDVQFVDWREQVVRLRFHVVLAHAWDPLGLREAPRDDQAYEVIDSPWVARLIAASQHLARALEPAELKHFKLCFNAPGYALDVIAGGFELR
jgi:hypothetical protein